MRNIRLIVIAVVLVLLATSQSFAGMLHEDCTYWFNSGNGIATMTNPTTDWLTQNAASLLVKVQESVYDQATSAAMFSREGLGSHPGYLYAYSVTNLNLGDLNDPNMMGITSFHVSWGTASYATVSHQTPGGMEQSIPTPPAGPVGNGRAPAPESLPYRDRRWFLRGQ